MVYSLCLLVLDHYPQLKMKRQQVLGFEKEYSFDKFPSWRGSICSPARKCRIWSLRVVVFVEEGKMYLAKIQAHGHSQCSAH